MNKSYCRIERTFPRMGKRGLQKSQYLSKLKISTKCTEYNLLGKSLISHSAPTTKKENVAVLSIESKSTITIFGNWNSHSIPFYSKERERK